MPQSALVAACMYSRCMTALQVYSSKPGENQMTISSVDQSQRKAARVVGLAYLLTIPPAVFAGVTLRFTPGFMLTAAPQAD